MPEWSLKISNILIVECEYKYSVVVDAEKPHFMHTKTNFPHSFLFTGYKKYIFIEMLLY